MYLLSEINISNQIPLKSINLILLLLGPENIFDSQIGFF